MGFSPWESLCFALCPEHRENQQSVGRGIRGGGGGGGTASGGSLGRSKKGFGKKKKKDSMDISGHGNRSGWFATQVA